MRFNVWLLLCGIAAVALVQTARSASDLYQNDGLVTYTPNDPTLPVIAATNFINNGTFIVDFADLFETSDTVNYQNIGLMSAANGFKFNTLSSTTGARSLAGSFYNSGTISAGQCIVNASNIMSPGAITLGDGGLAEFNGEKVDLSRSTIALNSIRTYFGTGTFGLFNIEWNPNLELTETTASSAFFDISPFQLDLIESEAFLDVVDLNPSNAVIRAVFIQDDSGDDVTSRVYFDDLGPNPRPGLAGSVTVEWVGNAVDVATGNSFENYLYLNNSYIRSTATNLLLLNGIPDNFGILSSDTQIDLGVSPTDPGFQDVFSFGEITNRYSYANILLSAPTVGMDSVVNRSPTNLPGRVEITAADELDLTDAQVTGANYLSLQCPKQFNGIAGALIHAPYSDFNLGVTNGFFTVSNLVPSSLPPWSGTVQAWSTAWSAANDLGGTNYYGVMIIGSQLSPTSPALIQNMVIHASNSIVISDKLNIVQKFAADARHLTLTTNRSGTGATSLAGELNILGTNVFSPVSALPNLRNLTNNGAIRVPNVVEFMGVSNNITVTPASNSTAASAKLLFEVVAKKKNIAPKSTVQIGTNVYTFVGDLKKTVPNQVKIGKNFELSMSNLVAAINGTPGAGKIYSLPTQAHPDVTAGALTGSPTSCSFVVTANIAGSYANGMAARTTSTNLIWQTPAGNSRWTTLAGGGGYVPGSTNISSVFVPYQNFINRGQISDSGAVVWTTNFVNGGSIDSGLGSFNVNTVAATLTNSSIIAGYNVTIAADKVLMSNVLIQAGSTLTLSATNSLDDGGLTNGSIWLVQSPDGTGGFGLIQRIKPENGDLRGTTINISAPGPNKQVANVWAGQDRGAVPGGYTNNSAVGTLMLESFGASSKFRFTGATVSNALYVENLELVGFATTTNVAGDLAGLAIDPNIIIYYSKALMDGSPVSQQLDGKNGGRLRWITNSLPAPIASPALTLSASLVSTLPVSANYQTTVTPKSSVATSPQPSLCLQWTASAGETYALYYCTNLQAGAWLPYSDFSGYSYGSDIWVPNSSRDSRFTLPTDAGGSTSVRVFNALTDAPQFFYQVRKE